MDERNQLLALIKSSQPTAQKLADVEAELMVSVANAMKYQKKSSLGSCVKRTLIGFALWSVVGVLFMDVPIIPPLGYAAVIGVSVLMKVKFKKCVKINEELSAKHEALMSDPSLAWLPPDYRNSTAWEKIAGYLTNMRADTLQDALNLFETEAHQERMESLAAMNVT
ncbi:MAG: hypothetical protein HDT43_12925 [Ruminococcaceae bacterium]|nr:hypothetical protein [Oscillospiraceae bacterium]